MPVEFLTAEQEARYGRFTDELTEAELARSFYLDAKDWDMLGGRRGDHNRLGLAVQLTSVRYLGSFPDDLAALPLTVITYLARQLQIEPGDWVERYEQTKMRHLHMAEIRATYDYHDFSEAAVTFPLVRFLYARAWLSAERPGALFDAAVVWLKSHQVLLPGITVLGRLVARVRDRVTEHVWQQLARPLSPVHQARLETLLLPAEEGRQTSLERLRRAPTRCSAPALLQALERLEEIRAGCGKPGHIRHPSQSAQSARQLCVHC